MFGKVVHCRRLLQTLSPLQHFIKQTRSHSFSKEQVLVSSSTNIYENLALEDWLYENADLSSTSLLLLWRNNPTVVIGRHQNPWVECNLSSLRSKDVQLARRKSGGGTVYHDLENLNISFVKRRELYNRKSNLQLVVDAIKKRWEDVNLSINCREDIVLDDLYKISGTASKLASKQTYHHFTLLVDVDKETLHAVLDSKLDGVKTNATASRPSQVSCLRSAIPDVTFDMLVDVVSSQYLQSTDSQHAGIQLINPVDESRFPGVKKHLEELLSWEWIFGKTPAFSVKQTFRSLEINPSPIEQVLEVEFGIKKGLIDTIKLDMVLPDVIAPRAIEMLKIMLLETRLNRNDILQTLAQVKLDWISGDLYDVKTRQPLDWLLMCVLDTLKV